MLQRDTGDPQAAVESLRKSVKILGEAQSDFEPVVRADLGLALVLAGDAEEG